MLGTRIAIQAALIAHEEAWDWDPEVVLSGSELADDRPEEDWRLEAYYPRRPTRSDRAAVLDLFGSGAPKLRCERLPDTDWVTQSQQGLPPIRAGRFHIHSPDHAPLGQPGITDFCIPAAQAFGTGQHATTAGCLEMLSAMKTKGIIARNIADVGTGTGLLAFAAMRLWPRALATASDIDGTCMAAALRNMVLNGVAMGGLPGQLTLVEAAGLDHALLEARAPYDLLIANILAGPLIELAPDFSAALVPGGQLLLAGLLTSQERTVRAAYGRAGFRLATRLVRGDWSVLWLRRRFARRARHAVRG